MTVSSLAMNIGICTVKVSFYRYLFTLTYTATISDYPRVLKKKFKQIFFYRSEFFRNVILSFKKMYFKSHRIIIHYFPVLVLLAKITRKIGILFNMSNFDFEKEKEDKARNFYQTYVSNYNSNLTFGSGEEEPVGREHVSLVSLCPFGSSPAMFLYNIYIVTILLLVILVVPISSRVDNDFPYFCLQDCLSSMK